MATEEKDFFKNWWEMQDKYLEAWKQAISSFQPPGEGPAALSRLPFESWYSWMKMQEQAFDAWKKMLESVQPGTAVNLFDPQKMMELFKPDQFAALFQPGQLYSPEVFARLQQEWSKMAAGSMQEWMKLIPTRVGQETMQKMMDSFGVHAALLEFWQQFAPRLPAGQEAEQWQQFAREWLEGYARVLETYFASWLPEPLQGLVKSPLELAQMSQQNFFSFFAPWLDATGELQQKMLQAMEGDREAYPEILKTWQDAYQQSFGKLFKVPSLGMTRESMEKFNASMDAYQQYFMAMNEFSALLYRAGFEAMDSLLQRYARLAEEEQAPTTFRGFYRLWWQTNEETFLEIFKTESFSRLLGKMVNAGARFKKRYDDYLAGVLTAALPIPTNREMDSVYQAILQLKRSHREQRSQVEALQSQVVQLTAKLEALDKATAQQETVKGGVSA